MSDPAAATSPGDERPPTPRSRAVWLLVALVLVSVPFLSVHFPPISDLPQQAAQVRLFGEALDDPGGLYRVQWSNPNTLAYAVLGASWAVAGPVRAGWLAMWLLALAWVTTLHVLAWRRQASPTAATLASILVFNGSLYWGFYSFVLGFPIFAAWFLLTQRPPARRPWVRAAAYGGLALLLGLGHLLWLACGLVWLGLDTVRRWWITRRGAGTDNGIGVGSERGWGAGGLTGSELTARLLGVLPVAGYAVWWFSRLDETGFTSPAIWVHPLWRRLTPDYLVDAVLGGLRGPLEPLLVVALLAWLAASALTRRGLRKIDPALAAVALLFLAYSLVLPEKYSNTIQLNFRWAPAGLGLLLLAVPPPAIRRRWLATWAVGVLAGGVLVSALIWRAFERDELSGLGAALAALPEAPRVIGLELGPDSRYIEDEPLLQIFAYTQVARGGRVNFSFAEFGTSLVVYREPFHPPWTVGLEWYPQHVKFGDFQHFDYALISGLEDVHQGVAGQRVLVPVTESGRWRLYRVEPEVEIREGLGPDGGSQRSVPVPQRR